MDDSARRIDELLARVAALEAQLAQREARIVELDSQVAELTVELQRRKKGFRPKANTTTRRKSMKDRRRKGDRKHPGFVRPPAEAGPDTIPHDVRFDACPECGGRLTETGEFDDHIVEDIPEPRVEVHRYRRHKQRCPCCQKVVQAVGPPGSARAYVGPRARLLVAYSRAHLGISLGKTADLLEQWYGLNLSRAGALGHVVWAGKLFDPVVRKLCEILRSEPVIHADETGWRINGKNVWVWCFCNPRLALFLVDKHRSAAVVKQTLGDSIAGVLVTDFYAAYHALNCRKQKCLAHLLRELHTLRDESPRAAVKNYLQPLMTLLQDAIALGKNRPALSAKAFETARKHLEGRLDTLIFTAPRQADCRRINQRLVRHRFDLLRFLEVAEVPPDNNLGERDIRSVAAARSDGGVNRSASGAQAFANLKSIIRTCQKHSRNFLDYGLSVVNHLSDRDPLPLPCDTT